MLTVGNVKTRTAVQLTTEFYSKDNEEEEPHENNCYRIIANCFHPSLLSAEQRNIVLCVLLRAQKTMKTMKTIEVSRVKEKHRSVPFLFFFFFNKV